MTVSPLSLFAIMALALTAAAGWLLPVVNQPTVAFGVRVPAARGGSPVITAEVQRYRRQVAAAGVVTAVAGVLTVVTGWWWPVLAAMVVVLAVTARAYLQAHRRIAAAKREQGWYDGLPQVVAVDTTLRTRPEPFPWRWAGPAVLVIVVTAVAGVSWYPWSPATFGPVGGQILLTGLLVGVTRAGFAARADLDPADPTEAGLRHRRFITGLARRLLILAACVDVALAGAAWWLWTGTRPAAVIAVAAAALVAGVGSVVAYAVRVGPGGSRMPAGPSAATGPSRRDDDAHWRLGLVYVNPNDPAVMVPQRVGVGWTLNLGRPLSWLALGALLAVPATAAALLMLTLP